MINPGWKPMILASRAAATVAAFAFVAVPIAYSAALPPASPLAEPTLQAPKLKAPLFLVEEDHPEARIHIELDISAAGEVSNARIINGGFGKKHYASLLLNTLKGPKFEPARLNGEAIAVERFRFVVPFRVLKPEARGSGAYLGGMRKALKFISDGDYAAAHTAVETLLSDQVTSRIQYAEVQSRLAMAYAAAGKPHHAILSARATMEEYVPLTSESGYAVPREVGELHMRLAGEQGLVSEALRIFVYLFSGGPDPTAAQARSAFEWDARRRSADPLRGRIVLTEAGRWTHRLTRNRFAFENLKGTITGAEIRCEGVLREAISPSVQTLFAPAEGTDLSTCSLEVAGEPGTQFEIVEFVPTS